MRVLYAALLMPFLVLTGCKAIDMSNIKGKILPQSKPRQEIVVDKKEIVSAIEKRLSEINDPEDYAILIESRKKEVQSSLMGLHKSLLAYRMSFSPEDFGAVLHAIRVNEGDASSSWCCAEYFSNRAKNDADLASLYAMSNELLHGDRRYPKSQKSLVYTVAGKYMSALEAEIVSTALTGDAEMCAAIGLYGANGAIKTDIKLVGKSVAAHYEELIVSCKPKTKLASVVSDSAKSIPNEEFDAALTMLNSALLERSRQANELCKSRGIALPVRLDEETTSSVKSTLVSMDKGITRYDVIYKNASIDEWAAGIHAKTEFKRLFEKGEFSQSVTPVAVRVFAERLCGLR